jgi:FxsC-like protein
MNAHRPAAGNDRRYYFFLSYAHTAPSLEENEQSEDFWVTMFFRGLSAEVRRQAGPGTGLEPGFMEAEQLPLSPEWTDGVANALARTEVFVPLLSPAYASRPWPVIERATFRARLGDRTAQQAAGHIQPVLWVPFAKGKTADGLEEALELGGDVPQYRRNGMLAISRLSLFQNENRTIVERLADRIVRTARDRPLGRSSEPLVLATKQPSSDETDFVVGVIAPSVAELAKDMRTDHHGDTATHWRPFRAPQLPPLSEYVVHVAQRLGLAAESTDLLSNSEAMVARSGMALIDPWILTLPGGRGRLQAAIKALPDWIILMLVADENDASYAAGGEHLVTEAMEVLRGFSDHVVKYARDVSELTDVVPMTVTQARRRYLNRRPAQRGGRTRRPSLRRPNPTKPATEE